MSVEHLNRFLNRERPQLLDSSLLEIPADLLGKDFTSDLRRSFLVNESDDRACASSARLWEEILEKHRLPFLLPRVADMRMALGSSVTALMLYNELQAALNDQDLGRWISERSLKVQEETSKMLTNYKGDPFRKFTPSQRWIPTALDPFPYCKVKEERIQNLLKDWKTLESYSDFRDRFINMHSLHTNYIEGTFLLNELDTGQLEKSGFYDKDITSKLNPPIGGAVRNLNEILVILQETREALLDIYTFIDLVPRALTVEILCQWHAKLMKSHRVLYNEAYPTNKRLVYTNIGVTRHTSRVNVTASSNVNGKTIAIQFCPYDEVKHEMELFCEKFNEIIRKNSMDPFACAAWISHTFVTIHPFEDGNGRMSRILSSIPLIRKGLPPLSISTMFREGYLLNLNRTRATPRLGDYEGLLRVLHYSTESGVGIFMLDYNSEMRRKELEAMKDTTSPEAGLS